MKAVSEEAKKVLGKFNSGDIDVIFAEQGEFHPIKIYPGKKLIFDVKGMGKIFLYVSTKTHLWYSAKKYNYVTLLVQEQDEYIELQLLTLGNNFILTRTYGQKFLQPLHLSDVISYERARDEKERMIHFCALHYRLSFDDPERFQALMEEINKNVPTEFEIA